MIPKPFQNRFWRGSGGHLGATLGTRCFQDFIFDDFGSILGNPLGPPFLILSIMFLMFFGSGFCFFGGLGLHFGSQNASKMRPKRGLKPKHEIHRSVYIYYTLATFRAAKNDNLVNVFFPTLIWEAFGPTCW